MPRPPEAAQVADELEGLASTVLLPDGPFSTMQLFDPGERAMRGVRFGREFLALQGQITSGGRAAIVTAGAPGAGKTSALRSEGLLNAGYRNIDPDLIKEILLRDALADGSFAHLLQRRMADGRMLAPMELSTLVHRESVVIAELVAEICMRLGEDVILQGSLSWEELPALHLARLEEHDYTELTILDVEVSMEEAIESCLDRWWLDRVDESSELGGRFVPEAVIRSVYEVSGKSRARENAAVMLGLSRIDETRLIVHTRDRAGTERIERRAERDGLQLSDADQDI